MSWREAADAQVLTTYYGGAARRGVPQVGADFERQTIFARYLKKGNRTHLDPEVFTVVILFNYVVSNHLDAYSPSLERSGVSGQDGKKIKNLGSKFEI